MVLLVSLGLSFAVLAAEEVVLYHDDFGDGRADRWDLAPGWEVHRDPDGNRVLKGEGLWQWAIIDQGYAWTDYSIEFRLKLGHGGLQLNLRLDDPYGGDRTRYIIGFREDSVYIDKESPPDTYSGLADKRGEIELELGVWHDVQVVAEGANLRVHIDGMLQLEYHDPNPLPRGTIALETLEYLPGTDSGSSLAYIDDLSVRPIATAASLDDTSKPANEGVVNEQTTSGGLEEDKIRRSDILTLFRDDFEDGMAGDWNLAPGWEVCQESDGNHVLRGEGVWRWAILDQGYSWTDYIARFRLKLIRGGFQFNFRLNAPFDARTRYIAGFREDTVFLSRETPHNTYYEIEGSQVEFALGTWHDVEIIVNGDTFRILVDGDLYLSATEDDPLRHGSIALEMLEEPPGSRQEGSVVQVDDLEVLALGESSREPSWVRTGGPFGGIGYDIRMRPDNLDIMFVTDANAGVFMSTDGGQSWLPSNEGITTRVGYSGDGIPAFCFTIDPHDHDIMWAGMRNFRGIFKSTDGGDTWVQMDNGVVEYAGIGFRGFTVDPRSSDIIYAAGEIASWGWAGEMLMGREFELYKGVVYKTTDGGLNWRAIWRGDAVARYVWIDPRDPDVLYVSTGFFDCEAANSDPEKGIPGGEGIVKSIDGGETWFPANEGLENLFVGSLFMHPENPDILLAGTGNYQYFSHGGVYLSTNREESWQHVLGGVGGPREHWYIITSVEFSLSDPSIAYAGSFFAMFRSEDGGHTWHMLSGDKAGWGPANMTAGIPVDFEVDPNDPDRIFANCYNGGNFLSADGGRTWTDVSTGYTGAQTRDIAVDPSDSQRVLVAARSGVFSSEDGGETWIGVPSPEGVVEWNSVALDPANPENILIGTNTIWRGILQSLGFESPLRIVGPNLWTEQATGVGWRAISFAPSDPRTVYAGTGAFISSGFYDDFLPARGIYKSTDGGSTWVPANDGVSEDAHIAALAADHQDETVVYAATTNHGLLKTVDGGRSWTTINQGLPSNPVALSVACHPTDPEVVFAGLDRAGIYRSGDGGSSWAAASAGMNPEAIVSCIVFDPTSQGVLFATDRMSGVYRSTDGGMTWRALSRGLGMRDVNALAIASDGSVLYAATEGGGVYRLDLTGLIENPGGAAPRASDRDGDGVPDDEDFCPDFPGHPITNGC